MMYPHSIITTNKKKGLEREKLFYESEIERINTSIHDMQFNPDEIQRVAREKFKMKRKNEDIYIISVEDPEDLPQP